MVDEYEDEVGRARRYEEDLKSSLGTSSFMNGDDPVRLITSITSQEDGVEGLYCPVFEVKIEEIERRPETCLEWADAKLRRDTGRGLGRIDRAKKRYGGHVLRTGRDGMRIIGATDKLNFKDAIAALIRKLGTRTGYTLSIDSKPVIDDPVCSVVDLKPHWKKIERKDRDDESVYEEPERLPGDLAPEPSPSLTYLRTKYSHGSPKTLETIKELGKLGRITIAPRKHMTGVGEGIVDILARELKAPKREWRVVDFAIDTSGSMFDDAKKVAKEVNGRIGKIIRAGAKSEDQVVIGLQSFVDDEYQELLPLYVGRSFEETKKGLRKGLMDIAKSLHGGEHEYVCEAASLALDRIEVSGVAELDGTKTIVIITDENLQTKPGGKTMEDIRARAERMGVEFIPILLLSPIGALIAQIRGAPQGERTRLIEKALDDTYFGVRLASADQIEYAPEADRAALIKEALKDGHRLVRIAAVSSIRYAPEADRTALIKKALTHHDWRTRNAAVSYIRYAPEADRTALIKEAMGDNHAYVRLTAVTQIEYAPEGDRAELIKTALEDHHTDIREILPLVSDQGVAKAAYLPDDAPRTKRIHHMDVRRTAVRHIKYALEADRTELIKNALSHHDSGIRKAAVRQIQYAPKED